MTKHRVEQLLGRKLNIKSGASGDDAGCDQAPDPRFAETWLMFNNFRLVRIDSENSEVWTPEHATVGTTEIQLRKIYGKRAVFSPHPYLEDEGHYVTIFYPGKKLIFETDHGKVTSFRYGFSGPVDYIEGCA